MIYQNNTAYGVNVTWLNATKNVTTPIVYGGVNSADNLSLYATSASGKSASNMIVRNNGVIDMENQSRTRCWLDAVDTKSGVPTAIQFDHESYDAQYEGNCDVSGAGNIIVKQSGYYQINCHVQYADPDPAPMLVTQVVTNGGGYIMRQDWTVLPGETYFGMMLSDVQYVTAGSALECRVGTDVGNVGIVAAGDYTYFSMHKVS
jgi:hypothetical protein